MNDDKTLEKSTSVSERGHCLSDPAPFQPFNHNDSGFYDPQLNSPVIRRTMTSIFDEDELNFRGED